MAKTGYFSNKFTVINNSILKNDKLRGIKSIFYYIDGILLKSIKKPRKESIDKKKVAIVYNLSLGDGAIFLTGLKNIREIYPREEFEITIFCQKGLNKIYEKTEYFDKVIPLNFTSATVNLKSRRQTLKELRKEYYDIVLDPIGVEECTTNVLMTRCVMANEKIGLVNLAKKNYCPKKIIKKVYSKIIEVNDKKMGYITQYNCFINGLKNTNFPIEFVDIPSEEIKENLPNEYIIIYPSASTEYKRWPLDRFVDIAQKVYEKTKLPIVVCGTDVDKEINEKFISLVANKVEIVDLTNKTTILEYIDLIKKAKFVITNDTGIYHIATVSQVATALLTGGYTFDKYSRYEFKGNDNYKKPYVIYEKMECFNCDNRCIYKNKIKQTWPCLDKISVNEAWKVIETMIDNEDKR